MTSGAEIVSPSRGDALRRSPRWATELVLAVGIAFALGCTPGSVDVPEGDGGAREDAAPPAPCEDGDGALGEACVCERSCGDATPRCARDRLSDPSGPTYCTIDCAGDGDCPNGYDCASGPASEGQPFCRRCVSETPGVVPVAEICLCDADCAPGPLGEASECANGVCRVSACTPGVSSSCPEGYGCEVGVDREGYCAECLGESGALEGASCGCSGDCASGLRCHRGACARPCEYDEQCGADTCTYRTDASPACEAPILDCVADASRGPGHACDCNADCGGEAPICLLGAIGDVTIDRCARRCTPGAGECPSGTTCCGASGVLAPTCLPTDVVDALGGVLQCA